MRLYENVFLLIVGDNTNSGIYQECWSANQHSAHCFSKLSDFHTVFIISGYIHNLLNTEEPLLHKTSQMFPCSINIIHYPLVAIILFLLPLNSTSFILPERNPSMSRVI